VLPERIEDAHPSLQPHFRQLAERLAQVNWDDLVRETVAFGSPDTVARKLDAMRAAGVGHVLCWMNFGGLPARAHPRVDGALRAGGHAGAAPDATVATIVVSSPGSTGLGTCMLKPALSERVRSCGRPYAVSAMAGVSPPSAGGSARTLRISE
jgi:hypothetical protein